MILSFIAGIIFLALGSSFLFAGVLGITFRNSDKEEKLSIPYMVLSIFTSLNYALDFIKNLLDAPSNWRDMKVELGLLGAGSAMSVTGIVLLVR
jgi:hypothetical protein